MNKQQLITQCREILSEPQNHVEWCVEITRLALAALTQPASPAFKLPDAVIPDVHLNGMARSAADGARNAGKIDGWALCFAEVVRLNAPHTAQIEPICATGGADTVQLPELNDELINILGRPNFTCSYIAQILRMGGRDIPRKSENEQAAAIHFLLNHYLANPEKWLQAAGADLKKMGVLND